MTLIKDGITVIGKIAIIVALMLILLIAVKTIIALRKANEIVAAPVAESKTEVKEEKYPLGRVTAIKHGEGESNLCYVSTENTVEPVIIDGCPVFIRDETVSHRIHVTRVDDKGESYGEAQLCFTLADICHKVH